MNKMLIWSLALILLAPIILALPECGSNVEVNKTCLVVTPTLDCSNYDYKILDFNNITIWSDNLTFVGNSVYMFNFSESIAGEYLIVLCDGEMAYVSVVSTILGESPLFIGGTINFINNTFPAVFSYSFPDYPYVRANSTNKFDFRFAYNGTSVTDANVSFKIVNSSNSLNFVQAYDAYPIWLHFNATEIGDYSWNASAYRFGYSNNNLTGTLIVRDYVKVRVKLWQDCTWYQFWCGWFNPDNQANYKNRFGYIMATPVPDDRMARANYSWNRQLQPLADLAVWGNKKFMDNVTGLYVVPNKAFSASYTAGQATLFLPANESYAIEFIAAKMAWDNPNGYGAGYYSKKYTESILLDGIRPVSGLDYDLEYKVSNYELHKTSIWLFWIVFGAMIMLLIIFAAFVMAFDPAKGIIMLAVVLCFAPVLWLVLKLIFWIMGM